MALLLFLVGLVLVVPFSTWLKQSPRNASLMWIAFGVGLFLYPLIPQFGISVLEDRLWPGHTKGLEVTVLDLAAGAFLLSCKGKWPAVPIPFRGWMKFYFAIAVLSLITAGQYRIGLYYLAQLLRMYLVFLAVTLAMQSKENENRLFLGVAISISVELFIVIFQKVVLGVPQPSGTFYHQNQLGVISNLMLVMMITPVFNRGISAIRIFSAVSGILIPALIASRATAMLALAGVAAAYCLSLLRGMSARKAQMGIIGAVGLAIIVPVALMSFQGRFKGQDWSMSEDLEYDERAAYKRAAWAMIADHPMGVGANNFVVTANADRYFINAGVSLNLASLAGHVHNAYILTIAELGWQGLIALVPMFFFPAFAAYRGSRKLPNSPDGDLLLGCSVALSFCYLHSFYEWMLVSADPQYALSMVYGVVAGVLVRNAAAITGGAGAASPAQAVKSIKRVGF